MKQTLLQSIRKAYAEKQGLSYSLNLIDFPSYGYMVSLYGREKRVQPECRLELELTAQAYIKRRSVDLSSPENFFGLWAIDEGKTFVLDVSVHFADKDEAIAFGRANQQEAIWDIANSESIYI
jgi:hypothetical protein